MNIRLKFVAKYYYIYYCEILCVSSSDLYKSHNSIFLIKKETYPSLLNFTVCYANFKSGFDVDVALIIKYILALYIIIVLVVYELNA